MLLERDFEESTTEILPVAHRYPLAKRLRVATKCFLQASGAGETAPWGVAVDEAFAALTKARNAFTHPRRLEDLGVLHALGSFHRVAAWFNGYAGRVMLEAAQALGLRVPAYRQSDIPNSPQFSVVHPREIFDEEFYATVFSEPNAAIRYIGAFSKKLHDELGRAMKLASEGLQDRGNVDLLSRAVRRTVLTISSNVEGTIAFSEFFMRAVRSASGRIACPTHERGEGPPQRIIRVLTAFSVAFGEAKEPKPDAEWVALTKVFGARDRLIHPRRPEDLLAGTDLLGTALSGLSWLLTEASPALTMDPQKVAWVLGSRKPRASRI